MPWERLADYPIDVNEPGSAAVAGKLYVGGGTAGAAAFRNAYEYDPATNTWTAIALIPNASGVAAPAGAELAGRWHLVGGLNSAELNTHYVYDPATGLWSTRAVYPVFIFWARACSAGGLLYVSGGSGDQHAPYAATVASLRKWDPATNTWTSLANMHIAREQHAFVALNDGRLLAAGGIDTASNPIRQAEIYDPTSNTWTVVAQPPTSFYEPYTGVIAGKVHIAQGTTVHYVYNPASDSWSDADPLPVAMSDGGYGVIDGKLYAAAGTTGTADRQVYRWSPGGTPHVRIRQANQSLTVIRRHPMPAVGPVIRASR